MSALTIKLSALDDLDQDFPLLSRQTAYAQVAMPTAAQCQPFDASGCTFAAAIVPEGQAAIPINTSVNSGPTLNLSLANATIANLVGINCRYYVTMTSNGVTKRQWAADFIVTPAAC